MPHHQKKFRFALVSHSIEVIDVVRKYVDPEIEELYTTVAGLDDAVSTADNLIKKGYEVVMGHGGTGGMIAKTIGQPVVHIPMDMLDMITALLKASRLGSRIGVTSLAVGREGFETIREVLRLDAREIIFNDSNALKEGVENAIADGVDVIVGGGVSRKIASRLKVNTVIIEPGEQIVQEAMSRARALAAARRRELEYHERLQTILEIMDDGMICVDAFGNMNSFNQTAEAMLGMDLGPYMGRSVSDFASSLGLIDALVSGSKKIDEIIKIRENELVVNSLPILIDDRVRGAVSLLKEGSAIHGIDRKLRERIYRKGFVAKHKLTDIVAASPAMRKLMTKAKKFAKTEAAILISGETGTGKEVLTHALHHASLRKKAPFVAVNCAALSETLLESELFGYEEGAFTGAKKGGKIGLFELANHGTIFLDEIGDISTNLQVRLLRVLENKEVMRVGGDKIVPVDVRIVSSTHKDLRAEVHAGRFRKDLYYRLAILRLSIPPLRKRVEDIPRLLGPLLTRYFKTLSHLTPSMIKRLQGYHWPGNIRELNSLMESYLILLGNRTCDEPLFDELIAEYWESDSPHTVQASPGAILTAPDDPTSNDADRAQTLKQHLENQKRQFIQKTLYLSGNNRTLAAKRLGISTNTLWRALKKPQPPPDPHSS